MKRRFMSAVCALVLVFGAAASPAVVETVKDSFVTASAAVGDTFWNESGTMFFKVTGSNTAALIEFRNISGAVTVPAEVKGYKVTSIEEDYWGIWVDDNITELYLPEGMTYICKNAFSGMTALTYVKFPSTLDFIGTAAFARTNIKNADLSGTSLTYVGDCAFAYNTSLRSISFPDTLIQINDHMCDHCTALKTAALPAYVESIGNSAFGTTALESIVIPDSVSELGEFSFENCDKAAKIEIGKGVEALGKGAFFGCTAVTSVDIPGNVEVIGESAFKGCTALSKVTLHEGTKEIGKDAFEDCTALRELRLPDGMQKIGDYAFQGSGLTYIYIPASVTEIGWRAIENPDSWYGVAIEGEPGSAAETSAGQNAFFAVGTFLKGDANNDGKVDTLDIMLLKRVLLRYANISGKTIKMADANGDSKIDTLDIMKIKRIILKID